VKEPGKIKAVAFDIDGTLYRNSAMYLYSVPFAIAHLRFLLAFSEVRKEIRRIRPIENLCLLQAQMTADRLGWTPDRAREAIDRLVYHEWERTFRHIRLVPGVTDLLSSLRARGIPVVAMSDFPVERKLGLLGLEDAFDFAFSSEDTHYLKPNPEPFLKILDLVSLEPTDVLYVGNSHAYDVIGAGRIGMKTAHFSSKNSRSPAANVHFSRYADLKTLILGGNSQSGE